MIAAQEQIASKSSLTNQFAKLAAPATRHDVFETSNIRAMRDLQRSTDSITSPLKRISAATSEDELRKLWGDPETRKAVMTGLAEKAMMLNWTSAVVGMTTRLTN